MCHTIPSFRLNMYNRNSFIVTDNYLDLIYRLKFKYFYISILYTIYVEYIHTNIF